MSFIVRQLIKAILYTNSVTTLGTNKAINALAKKMDVKDIRKLNRWIDYSNGEFQHTTTDIIKEI